jgi:chromosome segregation ATPase
MASEASAASSEPSDEMLQLISDLKAERDELKRDIDGWRMRVADADKQAGVLARRVEAERRDAWVARSRLGLLEVEKRSLDKALGSKNAELQQSISQSEQFKKECDGTREELDRLRARLRDADRAVDEVIRLRAALEQERTRRTELEKVLDDAGLLNTPTIPFCWWAEQRFGA